jgi:chromosomal replication initiation ATPase DnaA
MLSKGDIMDFFLLWEQVLDYINKNDSQYYQMFSYNVFPTSMTDTTLVITPNKPYLVRWINGVYREKLEQIVSRIAGKPMKVEVAPPPDSTAPSPQMPVPPAQKEAAASSPAPAVPLPEDEEPLPTFRAKRSREISCTQKFPIELKRSGSMACRKPLAKSFLLT